MRLPRIIALDQNRTRISEVNLTVAAAVPAAELTKRRRHPCRHRKLSVAELKTYPVGDVGGGGAAFMSVWKMPIHWPFTVCQTEPTL